MCEDKQREAQINPGLYVHKRAATFHFGEEQKGDDGLMDGTLRRERRERKREANETHKRAVVTELHFKLAFYCG